MNGKDGCWGRAIVLVGYAFVAGLATAATTMPAAAQTRFEWDSVPDVSRYTTFEECMAAIQRMGEAESRRRLTDTMTYSRRDLWRMRPLRQPASAAKVTTARACMQRFTAADTALDAYQLGWVMGALLLAGRDQDAAAVYTRRMAKVPATDTTALIAYKDTALDAYAGARPARYAEAEPLLKEWQKRKGLLTLPRLEGLIELAVNAGDTVRAKGFAEQRFAGKYFDTVQAFFTQTALPTLATIDSNSNAYNQSLQFQFIWAWNSLMMVYEDSLLDTLKLSTMRWKAARRALATRLIGPDLVRRVNLDSLTGKPAPAVVGDFWFGHDTTAGPRPKRGQVSLVVFVDGLGSPKDTAEDGKPRDVVDGWKPDGHHTLPGCLTVRNPDNAASYLSDTPETPSDDRCRPVLTQVRRLMRRYPALEVTLVSATTGRTLYRALPDSAAAEAEMHRQWFLEGYQLKGAALAVVRSKLFRLPAPDRRLMRVRSSDRNVVNYQAIGGRPAIGTAYLIDRNGLIVDELSLSGVNTWGFEEWTTTKMIDALLQQPASKP